MNDQNWTETPRALSDPELDAVLEAADRELIAEIERTTDTATHREEILKARPRPAEQGSGPAIDLQAEEPRKRGMRAAIGNFLIALTGADRRFLTFAIDRQRHITMGMLMLLTTGLAFYAGTTVAAMGFSRPFSHEIGYGIFFSLFVFFIDRSIVGYVTPAQLDAAGNGSPRRPSSRWAPWPRILIAIAASFLLSEVIVLQLFSGRIYQEIQANHIQALNTISRQTNSVYQARIDSLYNQINKANTQVKNARNRAAADYQRLKCQEFGCSGTPAGLGPLYQADLDAYQQDQENLRTATNEATSVTAEVNKQVSTLQSQAGAAINAQSAALNSSNDMLAREQALQQITSKDGAILILRIILWLVLVGIDLTPVIIKITTSTGVYEERIRSQILIATQNTRELTRRQVSRIQMETEIDLQNQQLDREIAQAGIAKKAEDLASIRAFPPADPT